MSPRPHRPGEDWRQASRPDGARIAYYARGDGPPLLLIPGLGQSSRLFGTLPRTLARLGWRAIAFDPTGLGRSAEAAPDWTVEGALADLEAVLATEGVERTSLLGTSLGGKLALVFAARAPHRVSKAFLYGSEAVLGSRARAVYQMLEVVYERTPAVELGRVLRPLLFGRTFLARHTALVDDLLRGFEPSTAERRTALAQIRAVPSFAFESLLRHVQVPVLCHAGQEDTLVEASDVEATARALPSGELRVVAAAGHSMLLENPEQSLVALRVPGEIRRRPSDWHRPPHQLE